MAKSRKPTRVVKPDPTPRELKIAQYEKALETLKTRSGMEGTPWYNGMIRHYEKLLNQLRGEQG